VARERNARRINGAIIERVFARYSPDSVGSKKLFSHTVAERS
jgi:hypothetical protein